LAGLFTWALTALGASAVLWGRRLPRHSLEASLGFAAGVMIAASYFSLLAPAIQMHKAQGGSGWGAALGGFLLGGAFLWVLDKVLPHLHLGLPPERAEGPRTAWQRTTLLVLAMTLHNVPEGLAVGVAFGALPYGLEGASLAAAVALTLGIGLQNFPEGMAVALPLRAAGVSRAKSFLVGHLSAAVEPLAATAGAAAVLLARPLLPYALAFAAGAMIFVVLEDVLPEAQRGGRLDLTTTSCMLGFALMMFLDTALS
jgi:ZIP family zinc transporter